MTGSVGVCQGTFGDAGRLFLCSLLRFVFAVTLVDLGYRGKLRLALIQSVIRALESRDLTCLHIIYSTHTHHTNVFCEGLCSWITH